MGAKESKEKKKVFKIPKINENERRAKVGLAPLTEKPLVKAKPIIHSSHYGNEKPTKKESNIEVLLSPVVFSFDDPDAFNDQLFEKNLLNNLSNEANYGWLPVEVIHNLLLMLSPNDLFSCICTCKLIYRICSTNFFWKTYYFNFFKMEGRNNSEELRIKEDKFNWKKQFFKRYSPSSTDTSMRKKWTPCSLTELEIAYEKDPHYRTLHNDERPKFYRFRVIGKKGVGKKSLVHRLVHDEFLSTSSSSSSSSVSNDDDFYWLKIHPKRFDPSPMIKKQQKDFLEKKKKKKKNEPFQQQQPMMQPPYNPSPPREVAFIEHQFFAMEKSIVQVGAHIKVFIEEILKEELQDYYGDGYFLCFDLSDRSSFEYLSTTNKNNILSKLKIVEERKDNGLNNQIKRQHRYNVIVVGLKSDIEIKERVVKREEVRVFVKSNNFKGYVECSSMTNCNVFLPFGLVVDKLANIQPKNPMPQYLTEMSQPIQTFSQIPQFNPMNLSQSMI